MFLDVFLEVNHNNDWRVRVLNTMRPCFEFDYRLGIDTIGEMSLKAMCLI